VTVLYKRIGSRSVDLYCSAGDISSIDQNGQGVQFSFHPERTEKFEANS
jgi:hypothetical protein